MIDKNKIWAVFIFLLIGFQVHHGNAQDVELKTTVNRTKVSVGQQFVLTIELSGSDAQAVPSPELPDISSFADYVGSSTSQNIQFINGKMSVSKSTANRYVARKVGKHQIPAVVIQFRGKMFRSDPISIEIVKGSTPSAQPPGTKQPQRQPGNRQPGAQIEPESSLEGNLFLRAEVDQKEVYQNQPITVTYKIYTRVEITNYAVSKLPDMVGFWSEDYSLPKKPTTYEEVIDGKRFLVAEIKKLALFPTSAGEKVIEPMEIECEARLRQKRSSRDVFDQFFNDDFFGNSIFGRRVRTKVASKPVQINVKPLPTEGKPDNFSGAVGDFTMTASIDKDNVTTNEAITLNIRYRGNGNIKMLPEPAVVFPPDFETYEPEINQKIDRTGSHIQGYKEYEYVLLPRYAGDHRIRPVTFNYFDPVKSEYKTVKSPEFVVHVAPASGTGKPVASGLSKEEVKFVGRDIRFIKQKTPEFHRIGSFFYQSIWFGILLVLPLLAIGGAIVYRQRMDKMAENVAYARSRRANQIAKKRLAQARKLLKTETQKAFYAEVSRALLGFVADKLNLSAAGVISDEVSGRLREKHVNETIISELMSCLQECDYKRFAPADSSLEDMKAFYKQAQKAIVDLDKAKLG